MTPLKIIQWNIKHFQKNKYSLSTLNTELNPQIICLQETWSHPNQSLKVTGYNQISHSPRVNPSDTNSRGGGVAILASNSIPITEISNLQSTLEVCAARVHSPSTSFSLISLYIPPNLENNSLQNKLDALLNEIPPPYLICTDANGHHPAWGSQTPNPRGNLIYNWLNNRIFLIN